MRAPRLLLTLLLLPLLLAPLRAEEDAAADVQLLASVAGLRSDLQSAQSQVAALKEQLSAAAAAAAEADARAAEQRQAKAAADAEAASARAAAKAAEEEKRQALAAAAAAKAAVAAADAALAAAKDEAARAVASAQAAALKPQYAAHAVELRAAWAWCSDLWVRVNAAAVLRGGLDAAVAYARQVAVAVAPAARRAAAGAARLSEQHVAPQLRKLAPVLLRADAAAREAYPDAHRAVSNALRGLGDAPNATTLLTAVLCVLLSLLLCSPGRRRVKAPVHAARLPSRVVGGGSATRAASPEPVLTRAPSGARRTRQS